MNYEAEGIPPLVSESPFMSWLYEIFSVYTFSALLGVFEVAAAVLIAVKPWWPKVSVFGSLLSIALFVATISFMFTTPGVFEASQGGFPALSLDRRLPHERHRAAGYLGVDADRPCGPRDSPGRTRRIAGGSRE